MIVRDAINARYTHDRDALVAWLVGMREFAGVPEAEIEGWLDALERYCLCADYNAIRGDELNPGHIYFWPVGTFVDCAPEDRARMFRVVLWKPQETARKLIEEHGFSCLVCGDRTPWAERAMTLWCSWLREMIQERQEVWAPVLACQPCITDLNCFMAYAAGGLPMDKVVRGFVRRLRPGGTAEEEPVRKRGRKKKEVREYVL